MSTERRSEERRHGREDSEAPRSRRRPRHLLEAADAAQIARQLTEKYGVDALAFALGRARRASEIGDELALDAWRAVIAATRALLRRMADA